jgi:2C-methyl-D-erythritol 2,4-cyclodiphosphate synthase
MAERLAQALEVSPEMIGLKAKTNEGMGWIGRGEGIAVLAVATLERAP